MQKTQLTEKQQLFCKYMFTPGSLSFGNGTESARKAGHKGTDNYLARVASENVRKCKIKAEKQRIQAEIKEKINIDRDYCIEKTVHIVETSDNERNKLTALSLLGDFIGAKRENAPNTERETAKLERMDRETKRLAERLALLLTRKPVHSVAIEGSEPVVGLQTGLKYGQSPVARARQAITGSKHALISKGGASGTRPG